MQFLQLIQVANILKSMDAIVAQIEFSQIQQIIQILNARYLISLQI